MILMNIFIGYVILLTSAPFWLYTNEFNRRISHINTIVVSASSYSIVSTSYAVSSNVTCPEYGTCSDCVKQSDCVWCSNSEICTSSTTSTSNCAQTETLNTCNQNIYTIIFLTVIAVLTIICCAGCYYHKCYASNSQVMRSPILPGSARHFLFRNSLLGDGMIEWMCVICGFDNHPRSKHCNMCGTSHEFSTNYKKEKKEVKNYEREKKKKNIFKNLKRVQKHKPIAMPSDAAISSEEFMSIPVSTPISQRQQQLQSQLEESSAIINPDEATGLHTEASPATSMSSTTLMASFRATLTNQVAAIGGNSTQSRNIMLTAESRSKAFNYRRMNQLTLRQKSARRRKLWQRVFDEELGQLKWVRVQVSEIRINNTPFGYTPRPSLGDSLANSSYQYNHGDSLNSQLLGRNSEALGSDVLGNSGDMSSILLAAASGTSPPDSEGYTNRNNVGVGAFTPGLGIANHSNYKSYRSYRSRNSSHDSFGDSIVLSTSPGYTSVFDEEGNLNWERIDSQSDKPALTPEVKKRKKDAVIQKTRELKDAAFISAVVNNLESGPGGVTTRSPQPVFTPLPPPVSISRSNSTVGPLTSSNMTVNRITNVVQSTHQNTDPTVQSTIAAGPTRQSLTTNRSSSTLTQPLIDDEAEVSNPIFSISEPEIAGNESTVTPRVSSIVNLDEYISTNEDYILDITDPYQNMHQTPMNVVRAQTGQQHETENQREQKREAFLHDLETIASLTFREKQLWFLDRMEELQKPWSAGCIRLEIKRNDILRDSVKLFNMIEAGDLHKWMRIQFKNEPGIDAGGLEREWFEIVTRELFQPSNGLFLCSSDSESGGGTYHINPLSKQLVNSDISHLDYFKFAGRLLGKAIMEQQPLPATLCLPLRKQILTTPVTFSDLEFVDSDLYKNLNYLQQFNKGVDGDSQKKARKAIRTAKKGGKAISADFNVEDLCLDFTVTYMNNGRSLTCALVENGQDISVTSENIDQYLSLRLRHRMFDSIKEQLHAFLKGFYDVIPPDLLSVFDYQELDMLLCGVPEIDINDWLNHTEYMGEYNRLGARHRVIKWFWKAVNEMTTEERVRLLQFVTGCGRIPAQGFKALQSNDGNYRKFNIQSIHKKDCLYPRAHTCFNKLDLPMYDSAAELDAYLSIVINMEVTGFTME